MDERRRRNEDISRENQLLLVGGPGREQATCETSFSEFLIQKGPIWSDPRAMAIASLGDDCRCRMVASALLLC